MKMREFEPPVTKLFLGLSVLLVVYVLACGSFVLGEATADGGACAAERIRRLPERPRPTEEGFEVKKVGSHYEPVVDFDPSVFRLPGTQMTFAEYTYLPPGEDIGAKYGFLVDDGRLFYVDEIDASGGDAQYALVDGYFVVDGYAFASSGHGRSMYLFKYGKDWVRLLDMIGDGFAADHGYEFVSDYPGKPAYGEVITVGYKHAPVWVIRERDSRGDPLIRVKIYHDPFSYDLYKFYTDRNIDPDKYEEIQLYLKVEIPAGSDGIPAKAGPDERAARLRVALDPEIYRPLFNSIRDVQKAGVRPAGYYVYGFLSGQFDLSHIKAELKDNKLRHDIVDMLANADNWDAAAHERSGEPLPKIVEYRFKRR